MTGDYLEEVFNHGEAFLWLAISLGILIHAIVQKLRRVSVPFSQLCLIPAFALFGLSDWIEAQTGAWWRPWWLLVMKAFCVLVFVYAFASYLKNRKPPPSPP